MTPRFILLLGSYDPDTEKVLGGLKSNLSAEFDAEDVYVFILGNMRLYDASSGPEDNYQLLAELVEQEVVLFVITRGSITDVSEIPLEGTMSQSVRKWMESKYSISRFSELPILKRLETVYSIAHCTLIVREREETRGGEYIELGYLLGKMGDRHMHFLGKSGVPVSTMVKELLIAASITDSIYKDEAELSAESVRAARHAFSKSRSIDSSQN